MSNEHDGNPKIGWLPDSSDANDYTLGTNKITALVKQIQLLRGCSNFLGDFEASLEQNVSSEPRNFWSFLEDILKIPRINDSREAILNGAKNLHRDLDVILKDLVAGIDLISAQPTPKGARDADFYPLIPPVSANTLEILKQAGVVVPNKEDVGGKIKFESCDDPELLKLQRVLQAISPIAQYTQDSELLEAIQAAADSLHNGERYGRSSRLENLISIDPKTMYELESKQDKLESRQDDLESERVGFQVRLPLNEDLSNHLSNQLKSAINYVLPDVVDLSYWCSPVKDQGNINACTSHAVASLVEYFQNRMAESSNQDFAPASVSALFLYKVTRRLGKRSEIQTKKLRSLLADLSDEAFAEFLQELDSLKLTATDRQTRIERTVKQEHWQEFETAMFDVGASIRQTLQALRLFGVPSERYWPYATSFPGFDEEPPQFCYAFAQNYQAIKYFRLDFFLNIPPKTQPDGTHSSGNQDTATEQAKAAVILTQIKAVLAAGFPAVFGFLSDPAAIDKTSGRISLPANVDDFRQKLKDSRDAPGQIIGHAALAVGYSDQEEAFLIQNSSGEGWGKKGYGWLPYDFVLQGLATDWWSLLNAEWIGIGNFGLDTTLGQSARIVP